MPTRTRHWLWRLAVVLTVAVLTGPCPSQADDSHGPSIVGAWEVTITSLDWPGGPLPDWYRARATFTQDGGLVQTVTDPFITTGHGSWAKRGAREFAVTTRLSQFANDGAFLGTIVARATIQVSRDGTGFIGDPYRFEFLDSDGDTVLTGSGVARGRRIPVVPIP